MLSLLDPRLWLAGLAIVLASSGASYLRGRSDGSQICEAAHAKAAAVASNEARKMEQLRQARADEAARAAAARTRNDRDRAARADRLVSGMRDTLDATERKAKESADASARVVAAYRAVFGSCVAEYRAMGAEAAGHAGDSLMYQDGWPK